ncbi:MAG: hypothetical protein ACWGN7_06745, partial [Thermodesulfovibrionales bacterium]
MGSANADKKIDIRGLHCPYTFVKSKLAIESRGNRRRECDCLPAVGQLLDSRYAGSTFSAHGPLR